MTDGRVDVATIARLLNLTTRRVQQLATEGVIPKAERGRYPLITCVQGYVAWLQAKASGEHGAVDLTTQRSRLASTMAEKNELELLELRGRLVDVDEVATRWAQMAGAFRARILAMPPKVGPAARAALSNAQAAAIVEHECLEALEELTGDGVPQSARSRRARDPLAAAATAEANGVGVGRRKPATEQRKQRRAGPVAHG